MKKTLVGAAVVASGLCVVANQAHAAQPQKAVGGVTYDNGGGSSKLEVNGSGTPASGRIQVRNLSTGADYVGQVNCYSQSGNIARMTGVITSGVVADGPGALKDATGFFFTATVQDNGEGSNATGPDLVAVNHRPTKAYDCTVPRTPARSALAGNLQVLGQTSSSAAPLAATALPADLSADEVAD